MWNPYLKEFRDVGGDSYRGFDRRHELISKYSFAVPGPEAIRMLVKHSPIIEIGAGSGYWAACIQENGGTVAAVDVSPKSWGKRVWDKSWFPVQKGDESVLDVVPAGANLLLVWPEYKKSQAYDAARRFRGEYVFYVGEGTGGCTADMDFFELIGCGYESTGIEQEFETTEIIEIPQWHGINDYLHVCKRLSSRSMRKNKKSMCALAPKRTSAQIREIWS